MSRGFDIVRGAARACDLGQTAVVKHEKEGLLGDGVQFFGRGGGDGREPSDRWLVQALKEAARWRIGCAWGREIGAAAPWGAPRGGAGAWWAGGCGSVSGRARRGLVVRVKREEVRRVRREGRVGAGKIQGGGCWPCEESAGLFVVLLKIFPRRPAPRGTPGGAGGGRTGGRGPWLAPHAEGQPDCGAAARSAAAGTDGRAKGGAARASEVEVVVSRG